MSLNSSPRRGRILVPANLDNLKGSGSGAMAVGTSVAVPSFLNDRELEGADDEEGGFNGNSDYHNRMNSPN
jgi:hypothetical protein